VSKSAICSIPEEYYFSEGLSTIQKIGLGLTNTQQAEGVHPASYFLCYNAYMKRLWAPWRMKFVEMKTSGCVFCKGFLETDGPGNLVIFRAQRCFVILNRFPYTSGHLLVVTNEHHPTLEGLDAETRSEMMELATRAMVVLRNVYHPDAFNFGANIGAAAGAGVAGHVHVHVVPRWTGDANFMLTLADTKVMPESLEDTYARLRRAWEAL
jgi:ATP adenylyltransferase